MPPSNKLADLSNSRILTPRDAKRLAKNSVQSVAELSEPQYASLQRKSINAGTPSHLKVAPPINLQPFPSTLRLPPTARTPRPWGP
ncbi:uncharacterized protein N7483_006214 [Penicillium malachiteum]|uniref:uncharacterized protein n=1 Tax=Penicillium malachiteum TaxID=1324776 RepID=UPI0025482E1B|nr:uncharacterized protein N7483_006214 [Penicillium malachiteum]KAJ5731706.1 hypothetical protein N7483_006214 [Penicillium malachiteum]